MIERAVQYNRFEERCKYILNTQDNLHIFTDNFFDFIYTYIVLQHIPSDLTVGYLKEFIRILKVGGILMFQIPVQRLEQDTNKIYLQSLPRYHPHRILNKLRGILVGHSLADRYYRLKRLGFSEAWLYRELGFRPEIQMHTLEEATIIELMTDQAAEVVHFEKREDELTKMVWAEFIVVKSV
jgi:predicted SAM-dependent methyltransferase